MAKITNLVNLTEMINHFFKPAFEKQFEQELTAMTESVAAGIRHKLLREYLNQVELSISKMEGADKIEIALVIKELK